MQARDVDALTPAIAAEVEANGERIEVMPLAIGRLARVLKVGQPILTELSGGDGTLDLLALAANHGERLIEVTAIALDREAAWVQALPADEFLALAGAVIEQNADFFSRRVLPMLEKTTGQLAGVMETTTEAVSAAPAND